MGIERSPNDFAVVGFTTSSCANKVKEIGQTKATEEMVAQLNRIFGGSKVPANDFVDSVYYDWSSDPFVGGGYVCVLSEKQREVLFGYKDPYIFFAGESYSNSFSSVGGAMQSSIRAADLVQKSFSLAKL